MMIPDEATISDVRRFNRFYTRRAGLLDENLVDSPFTLTEARVLYELAGRGMPAASDLVADLGLDAGYLSRILRRFEKLGLIVRSRARDDARRAVIALTDAGRTAFEPLNSASRDAVAGMLATVAPSDRYRLSAAMHTIERLLGAAAGPDVPVLREPRPGDLGWVVHRHGLLYAEEYGWDASFETLVAGIVARFAEGHDPAREACWIAGHRNTVVGSVFLMREDERTAKLRLLYVEPEARGVGIGADLVDTCLSFARGAGYDAVTLWTNDILDAARRIYVAKGFRLVKEEPHTSFGHDLVGQYWRLDF